MIVSLFIGLLLLWIISLRFAPGMNNNIVSMIGGLLSASATVILGIIAYKQNKNYKKLSDEANRRIEQLLFTPEFHVQMVHSQTHKSEMPEMNVSINCESSEVKTSIVCVALNVPIVNIKVKCISFTNCENSRIYENQELSSGSISIVPTNNSFSVRVGIPIEHYSAQCDCKAVFQYENIYQSFFEKDLTLQIDSNNNDISVKAISRAQLLEPRSTLISSKE